MELNHLVHFFHVARARSFTAAARTLRIQQPSVSRGVRLLEESLGVTLFVRRPRGIELTAAGERVLEAASRLFEEAANIERIAEAERGDVRGPLRIAASGAVASRLAPDALAQLVRAHPDVWPMVYSGPASLTAERIARGDLELGLYFYTGELPPELEVRPIAAVPFHLVVRRDRAGDRKTLAAFIGSREVEDEGARRFPTLQKLRRRVPETAIRFSTSDIEAHLRLVEAGAGVSILPRFVVAEGLRRRRLADVMPRAGFRFDLKLVTRKNRVLSRAALAFVEATVDACTA